MIVAIVATNLLLGIVAILMLKPREDNICDRCDRLLEKRRCLYGRYRCSGKNNGYFHFTRTPIYCSYYRPRKERSEGE